MNKILAILASLFRHKTVSTVMSDFHSKIGQLESVVTYQQKRQAKKAKEIEQAVQAQADAQAEAHQATNAIAALKSLTTQTQQITLDELKKEIQ